MLNSFRQRDVRNLGLYQFEDIDSTGLAWIIWAPLLSLSTAFLAAVTSAGYNAAARHDGPLESEDVSS